MEEVRHWWIEGGEALTNKGGEALTGETLANGGGEGRWLMEEEALVGWRRGSTAG